MRTNPTDRSLDMRVLIGPTTALLGPSLMRRVRKGYNGAATALVDLAFVDGVLAEVGAPCAVIDGEISGDAHHAVVHSSVPHGFVSICRSVCSNRLRLVHLLKFSYGLCYSSFVVLSYDNVFCASGFLSNPS